MNSLEQAAKALAENLGTWGEQGQAIAIPIIAKHMDAFAREHLDNRKIQEMKLCGNFGLKSYLDLEQEITQLKEANRELQSTLEKRLSDYNALEDCHNAAVEKCWKENRELMKDKERIEAAIEEALSRLTDAGSNKKHDPSWIRPMTISRTEVNDCCIQAYHILHAALDKAALAKGEGGEFPWECPMCGTRIKDPETLGTPFACPNCGKTVFDAKKKGGGNDTNAARGKV